LLYRKIAGFFVRDLLWDLSYPLTFFWKGSGIFFNLVTFYFLGHLVAGPTAVYLTAYGHGGYFPFVLMGLALASFQGVALTSISSAIQYGMYTGTLEAMLVTPTSLSTIVFASMFYQFCSALVEIVIYLGFGFWFFGLALGQANLAATALVLILTLLAHLPLGILAAAFILIFKQGDPVTSILASVSGLLGGVYFPVAILPGWVQIMARFLPFTYALEGLRQAVLNGQGISQLGHQILILAAFAAVLLPLSLAVFAWAVRQAKRLGTLSQF
jgi:ABC-2 type transport system permease protein